jgi:hypothetical protein
MDKNAFFARTMHTPDSPERAELRAALREISKALIPLHRHLIDAAKSDYAFAYDTGATPSQLVDLLQNDPFFAWLKPLTALIVDIDEMARRDFDQASVLAIPRRVEEMFAVEQYVTVLQRDVEVAGAHAVVRKALQRLTSGSGR